MPGLGALVTILSLDVVNTLVGAGYVVRTLPITDASDATPSVLTCATPHGFNWPINVVIAGATGNTAVNGCWLAVPTSPTQFALYAVDMSGNITPVAGNAPYTGGATVSLALVDGRILMGRQHVFEASSAPRVVFVPMKSVWGPKSTYNRSPVATSRTTPNPEAQVQNANRSIRTETPNFEVHVWGVANPPDPEGGDFDVTQMLYQQLVRTMQHLAPGNYNITDGEWVDQKPTGSQLVRYGHEFVFGVTFDTPVLDILGNAGQVGGLPYAPSGVAPSPIIGGTYPGPGVYLENPGGSPQPP